jgi:hypothetical protein
LDRGRAAGARLHLLGRPRVRVPTLLNDFDVELGYLPRGLDVVEGDPLRADGVQADQLVGTTTTVARIERNEIEPRMTTRRKLAQALGVVDPAERAE